MEALIAGCVGFLGGLCVFWLASKRTHRPTTEYDDLVGQLRLMTDEAQTAKTQAAEATEALRIRTEFFANVSHEIRTPLNGVLGMTSVLLETNLSREQYEIAQTVAKSGESLMAVLNEILDFSKLEANAIRIESFPFDVRECVEDVLDLFAGLANEKGLDLASRFDSKLPGRVMGDAIRVRQVLSNLVSNAVKFTEQGEVVVDVEMDGDVMVFTVSDSGVGISDACKEHLFVPFRQLGTGQHPGTGLGLVICKRLTELMQGTVTIESTPDLGTSIEVRIPMVVTTEKPSGILWDDTELNVAIIGPDVTSRDVLGDYLREWKMNVVVTDSGENIDPEWTDVVLVFSEAIDGSAALLAHDVPKVLVSWLADMTAEDQADAVGTSVVLDRPVRYRELQNAIRKAVQLEGTTTSTRRSLSRFEHLSQTHPRRILVAEDNPTNRRVVETMLTRLGYQPTIVQNGQEAVEATRLEVFDLILMDIHMPVMDGIEATRIIRAEKGPADQPRIVALTAGVNSAIRKAAEEAGVDDYITKPFMVESLRNTIEASQRLAPEAGEQAPPAAPPRQRTQTPAGSPYEQLKIMYATSPKDFRELIDGHIGSIDLLIRDMDRAIETHQLEALALAAHSAKASVRMFGQNLLGESADSIEVLAEQGDLDAAVRHFSLFKSRWQVSRQELEKDRDAFGAG
ncbi:MAG: response regulator [bacterium]